MKQDERDMTTGGVQDGQILIVDDDADVLLAAEVVLKKHFGRIVTGSDPRNLPSLLEAGDFDVLLLDMNFSPGQTSGQEGIDWLTRAQQVAPDTKVIMMTAYGGVDTAVKAIKEGASDFVVKPWDNDRLVATVAAATRFSRAARTIRSLSSVQKVLAADSAQTDREIIGNSPAMARVMEQIEKVAATDASVLILGENGTGKELIARAIHAGSARAAGAFVHVDLGAIAEPLFESELFGHKKGSFTDAKEDRPGRFEIASGGTLFLDEIGNLSLQMQAKLLGALQSGSVSRVGSDAPIAVDARIVSATNMPRHDLVNGQLFRQDLLYRINTVEIELPPLRGRPADIEPLVHYYADRFARKYKKDAREITPQTLTRLEQYRWPGNIRELVHAVERAVIMSDGGTLRLDDLVLREHADIAEPGGDLNLEALEARAIRQAIEKHGGNLSQAARELGLGRTTLYRKMAKHGI
jgi:two-component system, NtrC family, response regulator HydG